MGTSSSYAFFLVTIIHFRLILIHLLYNRAEVLRIPFNSGAAETGKEINVYSKTETEADPVFEVVFVTDSHRNKRKGKTLSNVAYLSACQCQPVAETHKIGCFSCLFPVQQEEKYSTDIIVSVWYEA